MPLTTKSIQAQRVQVPAPGTSVAASPQPFDNTTGIVVYNRGTSNIRFAVAAASGAAIADYAGVTVAPGASYTWLCGAAAYRAGGPFVVGNLLCFDADLANLNIEVQYQSMSGQFP